MSLFPSSDLGGVLTEPAPDSDAVLESDTEPGPPPKLPSPKAEAKPPRRRGLPNAFKLRGGMESSFAGGATMRLPNGGNVSSKEFELFVLEEPVELEVLCPFGG